tara:strand:- start:7874 stop:8626 length:753 start_codon:yes stop_codon:yes gene_type:complete
MSKVSIIIPYYKKKKYIQSTLRSVLNQTYRNLEILIIFDEEKKNNINFIKNLCKIDKRIRLIINKKNLGAGNSRNVGIKKSQGTYLAFIDSDDLWGKKKIQRQLKFMKQKNCEISHTSYEIINENNFRIGYRKARDFNSLKDLLRSCDIGLSSVLLKKKLLKKGLKFPKLKTKEDFVLWLRIVSNGNKIFGLNQNLTKWRVSKNALSSSVLQKLIDGFKVYNSYMKFNFLVSIYYLIILSLNFLKKKLND